MHAGPHGEEPAMTVSHLGKMERGEPRLISFLWLPWERKLDKPLMIC